MREIVADFILESDDKIKERGCRYVRAEGFRHHDAEKSDVLEARNVTG